MEINKKLFQECKTLVSETIKFQADWLNHNEFDLMEDTWDILGAFQTDEVLEDEMPDELSDLLLSENRISEERAEELNSDFLPSEDEISQFKKLKVRNLLEERREGNVIFYGEITCGDERLLVLTSKSGNSFDGVHAELVGIAEPSKNGTDHLFKSGTFVREE